MPDPTPASESPTASDAVPTPDASVPSGVEGDSAGDVGVEGGSGGGEGPSLVAALRAQGYDFGEDVTDEDVRDELEELARLRELNVTPERLAELEKGSSEFEKHREAFAKFLETQGQQKAPEAQEPEPTKEPDEVSELFKGFRAVSATEDDQRLLQSGLVRFDPEKGEFVASSPKFETEARRLQESSLAQRANLQLLASDPEGFLTKVVTAIAKRELQGVSGKVEELVSKGVAQEGQSELESYFQENWKQFYVADGERPKMGAGGFELNARGQAYVEAADVLRASGMTDEKQVHQVALQMSEKFAVQSSVPETAGDTESGGGDKRSRKINWTKKALASPAASGPKGAPNNERHDLAEHMLTDRSYPRMSFHSLINEHLASQS